MADLIDTTEMYLRTILELEEEGVPPLRARISERLGHSGPTVSQTVGRMERDGLVVVTTDRKLDLTDEGRKKAIDVMRKHRLAERLLSDVIGLEWEKVHEEACRWEHVMSEQVEKKIVKLLGFPDESPYGNPIPGLKQLGVEERSQREVISVLHVLEAVGDKEMIVRRLAEPAQVDPLTLQELSGAGVVPGSPVSFSLHEEHVLARTTIAPEGLTLPFELASYIFVDSLET